MRWALYTVATPMVRGACRCPPRRRAELGEWSRTAACWEWVTLDERGVTGHVEDDKALVYDAAGSMLVQLQGPLMPEAAAAGLQICGMDDLLRKQAALQASVADLPVRPRAGHVNELLDLPFDDFVKTAYVSVLDRKADPEGLALYAGLLKQGWSRSYVLCELLNSDEGRGLAVSLPGLKGLARRYPKAQARSLRGWYHRSVKGAESDLPQDRALRAALLAAAR